MSNKAGTSHQIVSLPKGGGALHGIGEKFSPDLFTGTGNFTVPIALPPGRNGFQPELNFVYSTGSGNGPFGLGWSLSIPGVSRKTSTGIPRYRDEVNDPDERDTFLLSGAEDLVVVEEEAMQTLYRLRTEGLFARITHHHGAGNNYWEVCSKDGLVSFYGTPRPSNASPQWKDPAVIADPDPAKRDKIFAWKLTETRDPFGTRIVYEYTRDRGSTPERHWDQLYLSRIRYIDYTDANGQDQFLVSVTFKYETLPDHYDDGVADRKRIYPFSDHRSGFEIRTRRRCSSITIATHTDQDRLTRTYNLVYLDERNDLQNLSHVLPQNGVSLLSQIKVTGHDEVETESLPPLEFGYTRLEPAKQDLFPITRLDFPAHSLATPALELADLFGNGLPDILEMNGTVRYWRNLGDGHFDLPCPTAEAPAGLNLADPGVQLIDADGDGRIDLLATVEGLSGYFPLRFGGLWDKRSFKHYETAPSFNLEDPEVRLVDLTGDGVTDVIRSGTRLECFFNDPKQGWKESHWVERRTLEDFPNINFSDPHVKWGDMSGDGLQDIVLVYDGNVEYWPNLGYGNWGKRIHMHNSPRFPYGYDPRRILVGDVDGDGLADIVYVDDTHITLWINQCGNGWNDPIEIVGTPPVSDMDAVRLVDLLGSGISGILWSKDAPATGRDHCFFLDLTGGIKPYQLHEMNNHMGALTRVQYKSSTHFYREDQKCPETRWKTPLPFPVQVVARVEVIDEISRGKLTSEYSYHHGYWDGAEREFRGFGRVEQRDTEQFEVYNQPGLHGSALSFEHFDSSARAKYFSPPLITKTWFHQGPIGDEFGAWEETDFRNEFWLDDPSLLKRPDTMTQFVNELPRRVKRDALRTLRGRILRTELYALDGSEREDRPYTATEYLYGVASLPVGDPWPQQPAEWQKKVFFPHTLAQRLTQWERGNDPMTQFSFTEDYDTFGQPRRQTQIACPRKWRNLPDTCTEPFLATRTRTAYATPSSPDAYIHDRVAKTTIYEIVNDGLQTVLALQGTVDDSNALQVIGQTLNYYDGNAFQGRDFGEVGNYGALVRTETLILTEDILQAAYPEYSPPYLMSGAAPIWTPEYPQEFRSLLKSRGGYIFHVGDPCDEHVRGYFTVTNQQYDFHMQATGRGLPSVTRDSLGRETKIGYDTYQLLPTQITDPAGLVTQIEYNCRVLQPTQVTDPNGNRTRYAYTPLGLLGSTMVMGRPGENLGDTDQASSTRFAYDFLAFEQHQRPISVRTIRREHHINDMDVDLTVRDQTIETVEYSDGFGRLLQTRTQAEDITFGDTTFGDAGLSDDQSTPNQDAVGRLACSGSQPNVVVSGWQIYDNKGRVVEKYEPFFACGWDYQSPNNTPKGQKAEMSYDPRGRPARRHTLSELIHLRRAESGQNDALPAGCRWRAQGATAEIQPSWRAGERPTRRHGLRQAHRIQRQGAAHADRLRQRRDDALCL